MAVIQGSSRWFFKVLLLTKVKDSVETMMEGIKPFVTLNDGFENRNKQKLKAQLIFPDYHELDTIINISVFSVKSVSRKE